MMVAKVRMLKFEFTVSPFGFFSLKSCLSWATVASKCWTCTSSWFCIDLYWRVRSADIARLSSLSSSNFSTVSRIFAFAVAQADWDRRVSSVLIERCSLSDTISWTECLNRSSAVNSDFPFRREFGRRNLRISKISNHLSLLSFPSLSFFPFLCPFFELSVA